MLLGAYSKGIFPMVDDGELLWFSPMKRGIIPLDERFHVSHGLKRALRKRRFEIHWDREFREVMKSCAAREETWIDELILDSYCLLHEWGYAHSVECWDEEGLQGGLYGVALGRAFFGESMFSRKTDTSKIALVQLVAGLRASGFELLDTQWISAHLRQFGAEEIPREDYLKQLQKALEGGEEMMRPPLLSPTCAVP